MKTNTGQRILQFIKERGRTSPKEIIDFIGFSAPAVFRQLKKLQERGLIQKSGTPPRVFYHLPMTEKELLIQQVFKWASDSKTNAVQDQDVYCPTSDIFQSRNERILKMLIDNRTGESLSYLLMAIIGEIGNNSFDHNFGSWPDTPGVYFNVDTAKKLVMLADRGRGVFATLKKVRPDIQSDEDALRVAFTEVVSGRSPEWRGNGLKFVKKVIAQNNLKLSFFSGAGLCEIRNDKILFKTAEKNIRGAIAIIEF